jgi:hypothetical protein
MKIKSAAFETSAPTLAQAPRLALPEFAFIGRSNVGKSSLLNLLAEKKDLARVSDLPGKTQLMNFYTINLNWRLVDLPGYGYAHVAKTQRADFNEAAADYITKRENLKAVFVLRACPSRWSSPRPTSFPPPKSSTASNASPPPPAWISSTRPRSSSPVPQKPRPAARRSCASSPPNFDGQGKSSGRAAARQAPALAPKIRPPHPHSQIRRF